MAHCYKKQSADSFEMSLGKTDVFLHQGVKRRVESSDLEVGSFLSGGIEPGDEEKLRDFAKEEIAKKIFAVDINSKLESSPGVKDLSKVKEFVDNLKK